MTLCAREQGNNDGSMATSRHDALSTERWRVVRAHGAGLLARGSEGATLAREAQKQEA